MKKLFLFLVLLSITFLFLFGEQEEIDYLLFLPNSASQFADEAGAGAQLDNVARYLRTRNLAEAQIYVYGYAADVANDIDPAILSRERALHVISELEKRGIARNFFTAPVGYGSVNLWGSNTNEDNRSPNRRVRILFEDIIITPEVVQEAEQEILVFEAYEESAAQSAAREEVAEEKERFPWWWLLLLLIPLFLLLLPKRKPKQKPKPDPKPAPVAAAAPIKPESGEPKYKRLTEEEIRDYAYKVFEERCHQHGYDQADWLQAINELTVKYEAQGYIVIWP